MVSSSRRRLRFQSIRRLAWRRFTSTAILATLLGVGGCGSPPPTTNERVPGVRLKGLDGSELDLSKPTGDVLLINFWATWCGPCRQEIPDLARLSTKYKAGGLRVIGLVAQSGSPDDIKPHVSELGINYPVYLADDVIDRFPQTGVGFPTTLIVNRSGLIVEHFIGARSYEDFERVVVPLLGARS